MRTRPILLVLAALAALPAAAEKADREKEIVIGADRSVGDDANHTLTLEGNVVVTQGTMRMTAAKVVVREDAQRNKIYVATGAPVTFRQKRDNVDEYIEGFAQRAEFDERNDMLKLFNNARVKSNLNEITGEYISYDMRSEVANVSGAPPGQAAPPNSRVKVIIVPAKKEPTKGDAPAKREEAPLRLKPDTEVK
jgi:lipopolysaccharide export system protein LptA